MTRGDERLGGDGETTRLEQAAILLPRDHKVWDQQASHHPALRLLVIRPLTMLQPFDATKPTQDLLIAGLVLYLGRET